MLKSPGSLKYPSTFIDSNDRSQTFFPDLVKMVLKSTGNHKRLLIAKVLSNKNKHGGIMIPYYRPDLIRTA